MGSVRSSTGRRTRSNPREGCPSRTAGTGYLCRWTKAITSQTFSSTSGQTVSSYALRKVAVHHITSRPAATQVPWWLIVSLYEGALTPLHALCPPSSCPRHAALHSPTQGSEWVESLGEPSEVVDTWYQTSQIGNRSLEFINHAVSSAS